MVINGKLHAGTFTTMAVAILQEFYFHEHQDDLDISEEQMNVIKTAA